MHLPIIAFVCPLFLTIFEKTLTTLLARARSDVGIPVLFETVVAELLASAVLGARSSEGLVDLYMCTAVPMCSKVHSQTNVSGRGRERGREKESRG